MFTNINKPAFGSTPTGTSFGFGASTSTGQGPFGQTQLFGKPANTSFGQQHNTSFGQQGNAMMFPSTPNQGSSLFPATNPGGFGGTAAPTSTFGSNIFGQQQQQPAIGSLFGGSSFGQQTKPTGFGFGSQPQQSTLFGQQPAQQQSSLFQPSGTSTLFGSPAGFGSTGVTNGTTIKFNPVTGSDTMQKSGVAQTISTKHHCITCMKEYESKSLEELRWEDYQVNRKGPQQQPGFGSSPFATAPTPAPSLFGQPDNKTAFGQPTGFGQIGSTFGQSNTGFGLGTTQTPTTNLFGKTQGFGTTNTTPGAFGGFGSTGNVPAFGSTQAKPFAPTIPTLFGGGIQSQPQPSAFGGNIFGQSNQNPGGNLFGKPAQLSAFSSGQTGLGFNQTPATQNTTSLFQQPKTVTSGFGMFGMQQQPTAGAFGQTSGFGQTTQSTFGGTFNKPLTFGQTQSAFVPVAQPSLFSNTQQKPGGLFGGGNTGGLFSTNFQNTTGLFGQPQQQLAVQLPVQVQFGFENNQEIKNLPLISSNQFGHSPHLAGLLPINKSSPSQYTTNPLEIKKLLEPQKKIEHRNINAKIRLKLGPPRIQRDNLFEEINDDEINRFYKTSCKRLVIKERSHQSPKSIFDADNSYDDVIVNVRNGRVMDMDKPKVLNLSQLGPIVFVRTPRNLSVSISSPNSGQRRDYPLSSQPDLSNSYNVGNNLEEDDDSVIVPPAKEIPKPLEVESFSANPLHNKIPGELLLNDDSGAKDINPNKDNCCGVTLERLEYYTLPPLAELPRYVNEDGRCLIKGFTVGRRGYGNLYFPDELDVRDLNLDEIVHFRYKEIHMYPEESKKPPVGEGLNRKAQVTLDKIYPRVKETKEVIDDVDQILAARFPEQLIEISAKHGLKFLDYRPETGSWVFMVDHFSKYAFTESDEETCEVPKNSQTLLFSPKGTVINESAMKEASMKETALKETAMKETTAKEMIDVEDLEPSFDEESEIVDDREHDILAKSMAIDMQEAEDFIYPPAHISSDYDYYYHTNQIQLMKATFFPDVIESDTSSPVGSPILMKSDLLGRIRSETATEPVRRRYCSKPKVSKVFINTEIIPNYDDLISQRCYSDVSMFKSRSFKVGWSKGFEFYRPHFSKTLDFDPPFGLWMATIGDKNSFDHVNDYLVNNLKVAQKSSSFTLNGPERIPTFNINPDVTYLMSQASILKKASANNFHPEIQYFNEVWSLCNSLWGPGLKTAPFVKLRLSQWLRKSVKPLVKDTKRLNCYTTDITTKADAIFNLVSCYRIKSAAELAMKMNLPKLSLHLAQSNFSARSKGILNKQLRSWRTSMISDHIDDGIAKIYLLLSGNMFDNGICVFEGLDWKRAFGLHLWFVKEEGAPLTEVIDSYCNCFQNSYDAIKPIPSYVKASQGSSSYDILYHILLLYKNPQHLLTKALNPSTYTSDLTDYRLSWLLLLFFKSVKIGLIDECDENQLHTSLSSQLEEHGLWFWAILPLLYMKNNILKKKLILGILERNLQAGNDAELRKIERKLVKHFRIPSVWVHSVKGYKNYFIHKHWSAFSHFIYAKEWQMANEIFMAHILPKLFVNNKNDQLKLLINSIIPGTSYLPKWETEVGIICKMYDLEKQLKISNSDSDLLKIQRDLITICNKLKNFPILSILHKLFIAEFSKQCLIMYQNIDEKIKSVSFRPSTKDMLDTIIMPPDYTLTALNMYIEDLIEDLAR